MKILIPIAITLLFVSPSSYAGDGLAGTWQLEFEGRRGVQTPTLTVNEADGKYSGTLQGARGTRPIEQISVDAANFTFPMKIETQMGEMELTYKGQVDGDALSGNIETSFGMTPFIGARAD